MLFLVLAGPLGPVMGDVVALAVCAAGNIVANRRVTFAQRGRAGRGRHYGAGLALAALPLLLTAGALVVLGGLGVSSLALELLLVTAINAAVTTGRFLLMRRWVFR